MNEKKIYKDFAFLFFFSLTIVFVLGFFFLYSRLSISQEQLVLKETSNKVVNKNESTVSQAVLPKQDFEISGGIIAHHLAARDMIDQFYEVLSHYGQPNTIVLLSPDHFNKSLLNQQSGFITINEKADKFLGFEIDKQLLTYLNSNNEFIFNENHVALDHGITNSLPFIKKYLGQAKIIPILIPQQTNLEQIKKLSNSLASFSSAKTLVIASVDFSHYLPKNAADLHDVKSVDTLINFKENDFPDIEVDCWQCLYTARSYAKTQRKEQYIYLGQQNSADLLAANDKQQTTSYLSLIFKQGVMTQNPNYVKTFIFVGDIMLDRGVEALMKKNDFNYPFEQVTQFFKGVDYVVANLEGPIVDNPPYNGPTSLKFAFDPQATQAVKKAKINLVSLANNHTLNMGKNGLQQTRDFLTKEGINYFGDPLQCLEEFVWQKDDLLFIGLNKTYSDNCSNKKIADFITGLNKKYPDKFMIVSIHWGPEYKVKNSAVQQKLAHLIIDAGADTILGHHPHVVQNIELYKNKLIFYSLGNFIFDQYFSKNTQEGLAVGLELYQGKQVYRLYPIQSNFSQPFLMSEQNTQEFLQKLADRSSKELYDQMVEGVINIQDHNINY